MGSDSYVVLADGTGVGYAEVGDPGGRPVVHLHGSPSSRLEVTVPALREAAEELGVRLIAPDRPGMGLTSFHRYSIADYPLQLRSFADALGLERFALIGVSGGGKYACACAWRLGERLTRVGLVSSTCSSDMPGAREAWSKDERQVYMLADRAPWLARLFFARMARDLRRHPDAPFSMFEGAVGPADRGVLASAQFRTVFVRDIAEAFRQGGRGPAHDYTLEARPWGVPLEQIRVPVEIWHGEDDRVVSPQASRILAKVLPHVTKHYVPGAGHFMGATAQAGEILRSVLA